MSKDNTSSNDQDLSKKSPSGKNLESFFKPKSVAVIGASVNSAKIGHQILNNIIECGFKGDIYPINPKEDEVLGLKAYPSVTDISGDIDLAVICIPSQYVYKTLELCAEKGVKAVSVITSGFAEVGNIEEEKKIKDLIDNNNIALIGPNIIGNVYAPSNLNASFGPRDIIPGEIAFISQSGALAIALIGWTVMEKIGLASLVSIGNKADIEEKDLIEYFNQDKNVNAILIYMEGLKDAQKFMKTKITKPVIILKVGRSQRGAKAAASHTGSLSGADKIYDAAFKQLGVLRADNFSEAFNWSRVFSLPLPEGNDAIIITNGGGIGVNTTDECEANGLTLLNAPEWTEEKFRQTMPSFGSTKNPIDMTGQGKTDSYRKATQIALEEDKVKSVIVLYCETVITDPLEIAKAVKEEYDSVEKKKPIVVAMVGGSRTRDALHFLNQSGIPAFDAIEDAVSALKILYKWKDIASQPKDKPEIPAAPQEVVDIIERIKGEGRKFCLEHEAREIMQLCGVPTPKSGFASNLNEALKIADGMYPLAMKIASPDIVHKTDVGGVVLNIRDGEELRAKYKQMMSHIAEVAPTANLTGVNLVQMMSGIECIVGLSHDPQFGPVVMFGLGGVFVEALKDVSFRIIPFGKIEAGRLLDDIRSKKILDGFRGYKAHKSSIVQTLYAVQKLAPLVKEVDINPLMSNQNGSFAVDARIILA